MRFLFVDRIVDLQPGTTTKGIKHITADDYYMLSDASDRRYFMPALVGEAVGQLSAWNVMMSTDFTMRPVAGISDCARVHRAVYEGEVLSLESTIHRLDDAAVQYDGKAYVGEELVFELMGALGPMLPMQDFIDTEVVKSQFDTLFSENAPTSAPKLTQAHAAASLVQFDSIKAHESGVSIEAEKVIHADAPYFADHFPKKPVLPLTILLENLMGLARTLANDAEFKVSEMRRIKMSDFVTPGDIINAKLSVKSFEEDTLVLRGKISRSDKRVCVLEIVMVKS